MNRPRVPHILTAALVALTVATGCGGDDADTADTTTTIEPTAPVIDPGDGGDYAPELDPADFVDQIDNPYLPFIVGSSWTYEGTGDEPGQTEHIEVVVLPQTKEIMGITATVVRDTVTVDGVMVEDTHDWFAQDVQGNVWYLGEEVKNFEDGTLVDTEGSWEAGVDGALPGIVMLADPTVGDAYRQEYYEGEAEDMGEVVSVGGNKTVSGQTFADVLVTRDWNPLEPDVVEEKTYAFGMGLVFEEDVEGGTDSAALIDYELTFPSTTEQVPG